MTFNNFLHFYSFHTADPTKPLRNPLRAINLRPYGGVVLIVCLGICGKGVAGFMVRVVSPGISKGGHGSGRAS